jgi:hypothetical protein
MNWYTDRRGRDAQIETVREILRDQRLFKAMRTDLTLGTTLAKRIETLARPERLSEPSLREIYTIYLAKAHECMGDPQPRRVSKVVENVLISKGYQRQGPEKPKDPEKPRALLHSWDEFWQWLEDMALRLKALVLS